MFFTARSWLTKDKIAVYSLLIQLIASWFLVTLFVFSDARPNIFEFLTTFVLVLFPHWLGVTFYLQRNNVILSWLTTAGLYFVASLILSELDRTPNSFVTGFGGVSFETSLTIMVIHTIIFSFTLFTLQKTKEQSQLPIKQLLAMASLSTLTFFFFGFLDTYAIKNPLNSAQALGLLDIKEVALTVPFSIIIGFYKIFFNKIWLLLGVAFTSLFIGLFLFIEKKLNKSITFNKKLFIFFLFTFLFFTLSIYPQLQQIQKNLSSNFSFFQLVWNRNSLIRRHTLVLRNTPINIWCDKTPVVNEQTISCDDRLFVAFADAPLKTDGQSRSTSLNMGLFGDVHHYLNQAESCIFTKNKITIQNKPFVVSTQSCDDRNFPTFAEIKWDEFTRPLLHCFGFEKCKLY